MEGGPRLSSGGCWVLAINPVTLASRRLIIFRIASITPEDCNGSERFMRSRLLQFCLSVR